MLILKSSLPKIEKFLSEGTSAFLHEFPNLTPTCVALYSSPANGWVSLCVDITQILAAPLTNCPDFSYVEFRLLELPDWAAEYQLDHPFVQRHDGVLKQHSHDDGDDAFNEAFFHTLMKASNDYYHAANDIIRPTWAGVQMLDSSFLSFWRVKRGAENV
jgi:hypothetical protein